MRWSSRLTTGAPSPEGFPDGSADPSLMSRAQAKLRHTFSSPRTRDTHASPSKPILLKWKRGVISISPSCATHCSDRSAMLRVRSDIQRACPDICIWDKSMHGFFFSFAFFFPCIASKASRVNSKFWSGPIIIIIITCFDAGARVRNLGHLFFVMPGLRFKVGLCVRTQR